MSACPSHSSEHYRGCLFNKKVLVWVKYCPQPPMCIIKNQFISLIHFGQPSHRKKREKAILESNLDYQDEEDIEVGFTTTITPVKIKRKRNTNKIKSSNDYDELPKCQFHISETLPATVFSPKDLAKNHLPMHKVRSTTLQEFLYIT